MAIKLHKDILNANSDHPECPKWIIVSVIKGENHHNSENIAVTVPSHAHYRAPKHPAALTKGLGTKVLSTCLIFTTNRKILWNPKASG